MAYIYANLVFNGKKTLDQVPKALLEKVNDILEAMKESQFNYN